MLFLITGNPGNAKTLFTVSFVEALRIKDQREVFQDGISDLVFPWHALPIERRAKIDKRGRPVVDGTGQPVEIIVPLWEHVPDGAVVVIDEAWRVFPVRPQGSAVPDFVEWLATHRHHGIDVFLVTQSVKTQVDTFVRGLVGKHIHLDRKFGMEYSMKYEWERVADPTSTKDIALAQNSRWIFPKELYGKYKSAVEHTHKRSLPWKKFAVLVGALVCAVGGFGLAFHRLGVKKPAVATDSSGRAAGGPVRTASDFWVRDRIARVAGIPASAPVFDSLQRVQSQPRPEGCMEMVVGSSVRCQCTGPHASVLQIGLSQCLELVKKGWFDETQKYADVKAENIAQLNSLSASPSTGDDKPANP